MNYLKMAFLESLATFVLVLPIIYNAAQSCTTTDSFSNNWFGANCQYKCHCKDNAACNFTNGDCPNGCDSGWFGPACQYADIAKNATLTYHNDSLQTVALLTDGNDTTCAALTGSNWSLDVTWNFEFYFTWLRIVIAVTTELQKDSISIEFPENVTTQLLECSTVFVDNITLDIYCNTSEVTDKIVLNGSAVGSMCSLYISQGRNVALRQTTSQTTTQENHINFLSSNAVDGNPSWNRNSCTHTNQTFDPTPMWTVVFNQTFTVQTYTIHNRVGALGEGDAYCCLDRLKGFLLTTFDQTNQNIQNYTDNQTSPKEVYNVLPTDPWAKVSKVQIEATYRDDNNYIFKYKVLTLCEVEIFGDSVCPKDNNTYGRDCENVCNCAVPGERCFVSTGNCPSGCKAGFYGQGCTKNCDPGLYGNDCRSVCSRNCSQTGQICDVINGNCLACNRGFFGDKCTTACPTNCNDSVCDIKTGDCISCTSGYYGTMCTNPCSDGCNESHCEINSGNCTSCKVGFYGANCSSCPNNCQNVSCDNNSVGFNGYHCSEDCDPGSYGDDCRSNCSRNCSQTGQICDVIIGNCMVCNAGFYGDTCTSECQPNCKDSLCDFNTGYCLSCKSGYYGTRCTNPCSNNCKEFHCEINSVNCTSCEVGFYGANCSTPCPTNCKNLSCDFNSGNCSRCSAGFKGYRCDEVTSAASDDRDGYESGDEKTIIGAVVGSVCGVLVVVLVIGGFLIFWRRHKKSDTLEDRQNTSSMVNFTDTASLDRGTSVYKLESKENKHSAMKPTVPQDNNAVMKPTAPSKLAAIKPTVPPKPKIVKAKADNSSEEKGTGYYNTVTLQTMTSSTVIPLSNLQSYLLTHSKEYLHEQFKNLPDNTEATMMVGLSEENKNKNRYKNICAYDHSRVHLEADSKKMQGDYINASYLKGYADEEKFIASQGPTKVILNDFVRMLWEQKVEKVVMLTNLVEDGKSKCDPYWPDEGEMTFGEIRVRLAATQVFADYIIRRLQLYVDSQPMHPVTQFHFTSWPDKGVPENPWALVDFEQRVAATATKRPIVVHCSAGVGRTGTFITLRNVMREAEDTQHMDFFTTVAKLRQDRTMMIQTAEQYVFLHEAAKVAMTCINTTITSNNIANRVQMLQRRSVSGKTEMEIEFEAVCSVGEDDVEITDEEGSAGIMYQNSRTVSNKLKNRFGNILPKALYRPVLMCDSSDMGDYINAVLTPSFRKRNQDILTQLPLPTTVVDFWRLITQMKVSLVVAFEEQLKTTDSTIGQYLPASQTEKASFPPFQVNMGTLHQGSDWEERKLIVTGSKEAKEHSLVHLRYTQNATDPNKILAFLKHARTYNPENNARILYMCRNGATFSGLACVLTLLLDRMDNDQRLTVPLVVGAIKTIRPQVIPTVEQYKVLYQALQIYNEASDIYFNLNDPKLSVPSIDDGKDHLGNVGNEGTEYANSKV